MPNSLKSILNLVARLKEHMLRHSKYLRPLGGTALALLIFTFSSKAIQDIVVFGAAIYAVYIAWRTGSGLAAWRQPAGIAFTALVLYIAFSAILVHRRRHSISRECLRFLPARSPFRLFSTPDDA